MKKRRNFEITSGNTKRKHYSKLSILSLMKGLERNRICFLRYNGDLFDMSNNDYFTYRDYLVDKCIDSGVSPNAIEEKL